MNEIEVRGWLCARIAQLAGAAVDPRATFHQCGVGSLEATRIAAELSEAMGRDVSPVLFWEHPSAAALARHLSGGAPAPVEGADDGARGRAAPGEPIAIVGMACRLPGAPDLASFWQLLASGTDAVGDAPADRAAAIERLAATAEERRIIRRAGWLPRVDGFDPFFFGISPREARAMDPQQRLAIELCWEALEDAGAPPPALAGSRAGVFAAAIWSDYALLVDRAGPERVDQHTVTGWHHSIIANRISYVLGLHGPSMTLDAACSSALVGVHLACESLRRGECEIALAPAVNLILVPESALGVARFGALSPDGRCYTFDARANGYVRGEGGGAVVLKTLSRAVADGDRIHAIIRGSAVNNDGASSGLTAPNPRAQEALLREAYRRAGVDPREVQYVEAHGTGTPLGDPIEARAIGAVLGSGRGAGRPLLVGSVKTNIGHLEGAAGVAGLIKTALSLRHRQIPESLHFASPSPHIGFADLGIEVPERLRPFPAPEQRLIAGVSAFGLGGTNAHVVLEEHPAPIALDRPPPQITAAPGPGGVALVFPGQGAHWPGMARALMESEPVFRRVMARCDALAQPILGVSLIDEVLAPPDRSRLDRIDLSLPAIIACDVAMAALLRSLGVEPAAVVGHSTGEIAAAHVAGALDLADTMRIICAYGRVIARTAGRGRMAHVELPWAEAAEAVRGFEGRVFPAIWDSAEATVLAGEPAAIDEALAVLRGRGIGCRAVAIDVAPHSPLVDDLRADLASEIRGIRPRASRVPLYSEVTGGVVPGEALDVAHWVRNFGDQALFSPAVDAIIARGHRVFVDVGPHPITRRSVQANLKRAGVPGLSLATAARGEDARATLIAALDELDRAGLRRASAPRAAVVPLSARSKEALAAAARAHAEALSAPGASLPDIAYTAGARRGHFEHRLAASGATAASIAAALRASAEGGDPPAVAAGRAPRTPPRVVFVFPGQGSQWAGMGRALLDEEPVFRGAIEACDRAIRAEAGFSVIDEICAGEAGSRLAEIDVVQPALFAIEVALAALFRSWGVEPAAVVGHSMGEAAAAHVAGALSLDDAAAVICRRSRLLRGVSGRGAMALVELSLAEAEEAIAGREDQLGAAVSNGPRSTVIAGDPAALDEVLAALDARGVFCRRVKVDVASHSPQMDPLRGPLLAALAGVAPKAAEVAMRSTVSAAAVRGDELSAAYWVDNLRLPVRFAEVVQGLAAEGHTIFLEMSPHPILTPSIEENLRAAGVEGEARAIASLRRGQPERASLLESIGRLYALGLDVRWDALHPDGGRVVDLPGQPWQRERCWIDEAAPRAQVAAPAADPSDHPLLGARIALATRPEERAWEAITSIASIPWLADHRVQGEVVFPGAGYLVAARAAAARALGAESVALEAVAFDQMLSLPPEGARSLQTIVTVEGDGRASFVVASRGGPGEPWTRHASGTARAGAEEDRPTAPPLADLRARLRQSPVEAHHDRMRQAQIHHGPAFQGMVGLWTGDGEALAQVRLPDHVSGAGYDVHPAWLDACLQASAAVDVADTAGETHVPVGVGRLVVRRPPRGDAWVLARARGGAAREIDLLVLDGEGALLAAIDGLRTQRIDAAARAPADPLAGAVIEVALRPAPPAPLPPAEAKGAWLVVSDEGGVAEALAAALDRYGHAGVRVVEGPSYERLGERLYQIDPRRPADYERLLRDAFGDGAPCAGAVHLASLDATPLARATLETLDADLTRGCVSATYLAQAIVRHGFRDAPRLSIITRGAQAVAPGEVVSVSQAPVIALARTLRIEHPALACLSLDLDPAADADVEAVVAEIAAPGREAEVAIRDGARHVARLARGTLAPGERPSREPAVGRPFALQIHTPGALDGLALHAIDRPAAGPGEVIIEVEAAGLNFRDVLAALGAIPDEAGGAAGPRLGSECAGRVAATGEGVSDLAPGDEVIAVADRAFGTFVAARRDLVARKPAALGWDQAATFPIVFLTAAYALGHVAHLDRGERVLIHAGAGGVGLAAIQWAQRAGAEVFATAGSEEKRAYLRALGVPHVLDSRSAAFAEEIRRITGGEGVDVVLNSVTGDLADASLAVLRDHGRFIELGKRDAQRNRPLATRPFLRNLSFSLVDLHRMMEKRPAFVGALLRDLLGMVEASSLAPLPVTALPASRAAEAFQRMAQARHIGKLAISFKDPDAQVVAGAAPGGPAIRADRTYLITGGLGGLGLSLARWLVAKGARSLVLAGRRPPIAAAAEAIRGLAPARARAVQADVSRPEDVARLVAMIRADMPPLAGVFHAAAVLDDHTLMEQTEEGFRAAFAPKGRGAFLLHEATRGEALDLFVLYSSVASTLGSPGQANYGAANAFLDALARERARLGLPALSIQWGAFSEVGLAAAEERRGARLAARGFASMTPEEGLDALSRALGSGRAEVAIARFDARQWIQFHPALASSPFFSEIAAGGARPAAPGRAVARILAAPEPDRAARMEEHLVAETAAVLRCEPSRVDPATPFQALGIDSLMSLELRNRLEASLGVRLSATVLFTHATARALGAHLLSQLGGAQPAPRAEVPPPKRREREAGAPEPIAVVGLACRFPGGGDSPEAFFRALEAGVDAVRPVSPLRWPADAVPGGGPETRWAGLLDGVDLFDAAFFGVSPREAAQLDPQHRLLLEVTWEALERAGQAHEGLPASRAGVFVGLCNTDYVHLIRRAGVFDAYTATGNLASTAAGRIAYALGLEGPCLTVDTACSSSLTAVHLAAQSLRSGECDLAVSGGVNLLLDPVGMRIAASTQALSPDGRSKAFDAAANGFVRGEGCGVVVLKRLSDAQRDGDPILAVLRGSAMNQDGRSAGLTAPNVLAQQALVRRALEDAGVGAEEIGYVETHGTGTPLGDPIEFEALRGALGAKRADGSACVLGAVKTNVGHLEAAAGVAGLIKAVLCLAHEAIPGNLHFEAPNPRLSLEETPFVIPARTVPWPRGRAPRRAGVSAFGISGTNVHVIVEEAPRDEVEPRAADPAAAYLLPLSARDEAALVALATAWAGHLDTTAASLRDLSYTASVRRRGFAARLAVMGRSKEEVGAALRALAASGQVAGALGGDAPPALTALARDWVAGRAVDFTPLFPEPARVVALPAYPWQRRRYWFDAGAPEVEEIDGGPAASGERSSLPRRVLAEVARVLRLDPAQLDPRAHFAELGMDSLMSLELRNRLEAALEHRLSAAAMLAHPSVAALTAHLEEVVSGRAPAPEVIATRARGEALGPCLLTGATGFLGVHLLRSLLAAGHEKVICLVRADDEAGAVRRLRSAMRHYCGDTGVDWARVEPALGDLTSPWLGVGEQRFHAIAAEVSAIYHNGAMLDFVLPYERLAAANVAATAEIVRMARLSGRAVLHHVSTVGVIAEGHPERGGRLLEVEAAEEGPPLIPCGYTTTKRDAEQLVLAAMRDGVPAVVYRPAIISGSTRTGRWNLDDAVCRILKGCVQAGAAPDLDWRANLCPVDFVADAVVSLSRRADSAGQIFHLANVEPTHFSEMVGHLRRRGYDLSTVSYDAWLQQIEAQGAENALFPLLPWMRDARPFLRVEYDCANLLGALAGSGLRCPAAGDGLFDLYVDAFAGAGFLPPPEGLAGVG